MPKQPSPEPKVSVEAVIEQLFNEIRALRAELHTLRTAVQPVIARNQLINSPFAPPTAAPPREPLYPPYTVTCGPPEWEQLMRKQEAKKTLAQLQDHLATRAKAISDPVAASWGSWDSPKTP